eukprot:CAMPEP_0114640792 /NCGR_PEP_ID=MMETSP0191-20121206/1899_1 /TAXON_ID=126664 /ORGANISM="Sorites sp." /LENGTH=47 /DNA_ID= /DNA_START= /DNA_END= /DNA_ORIENTATION=
MPKFVQQHSQEEYEETDETRKTNHSSLVVVWKPIWSLGCALLAGELP